MGTVILYIIIMHKNHYTRKQSEDILRVACRWVPNSNKSYAERLRDCWMNKIKRASNLSKISNDELKTSFEACFR